MDRNGGITYVKSSQWGEHYKSKVQFFLSRLINLDLGNITTWVSTSYQCQYAHVDHLCLFLNILDVEY